MINHVKRLFIIVIGRKERNKNLNFDKRFDTERHPYKMIYQIIQIEC